MRRTRVLGQPHPHPLPPPRPQQSENDLWPPMAPNNPVSIKVLPPSPALHIKKLPTPVIVASFLENSLFRPSCQGPSRPGRTCTEPCRAGRVIKDRFFQGVIFVGRIIMGQIVQKKIVQNRVVQGLMVQTRCIWQSVQTEPSRRGPSYLRTIQTRCFCCGLFYLSLFTGFLYFFYIYFAFFKID